MSSALAPPSAPSPSPVSYARAKGPTTSDWRLLALGLGLAWLAGGGVLLYAAPDWGRRALVAGGLGLAAVPVVALCRRLRASDRALDAATLDNARLHEETRALRETE